MIRETLAVGLLGCNCSILGDEQSREAIVVDPGYDIPQILYSQADLPLVAMMDAQAGMFGLPVPKVLPPDHSPADGEAVRVGGIEGTVLYTPGHSEGSVCLYVPDEHLLL